jgi:NAD(P)-dependent dehydrogenase (short-subunit alcohol dehydrogenase family)
VVADASEPGSRETARMINEGGGRALAVRCDVSQAKDVKAALDKTVETFGRLDYAFNNAGVEQPVTPAADITEAEWDRIIDIDLRSVFICMKHEIPLMLQQGGGAIVNTSSGAGVKGIAGQAAYCAAKYGVVGLSKAAALDYAKSNIRVNAVCPGIIETPMMDRFSGGTAEGRQRVIAQEPVGRMGRPEDGPRDVRFAKQMGAERIIAMSRHETRQRLAREFGATDIVTEWGDEGAERIKELTRGVGADSVLECVGTQESMWQAIHAARPGGHVSYVGVPHGVQLDGAALFFTHVRLHGGPAPVRRYLPNLIDLVLNGTIAPGKVFDLTLPLDRVAEGYRAMDERRAIKTLLLP